MNMLFMALVTPHPEFGNSAWSPWLEKDKKMVESVLRRELYKDSPCWAAEPRIRGKAEGVENTQCNCKLQLVAEQRVA